MFNDCLSAVGPGAYDKEGFHTQMIITQKHAIGDVELPTPVSGTAHVRHKKRQEDFWIVITSFEIYSYAGSFTPIFPSYITIGSEY